MNHKEDEEYEDFVLFVLLVVKNLFQLIRRRNFELVISAIGRLLVRTPPQKVRGVTESRALHVVVRHFADALDAQRLPAEILAAVPAARPARHPLPLTYRLRPIAPRMFIERILSQRLELTY